MPEYTSGRGGFVDVEYASATPAPTLPTVANDSWTVLPRWVAAVAVVVPVSPTYGSTSYATAFVRVAFPAFLIVTRYLIELALGGTPTLTLEFDTQSHPPAAAAFGRQISLVSPIAADAARLVAPDPREKTSLVTPSRSMSVVSVTLALP